MNYSKINSPGLPHGFSMSILQKLSGFPAVIFFSFLLSSPVFCQESKQPIEPKKILTHLDRIVRQSDQMKKGLDELNKKVQTDQVKEDASKLQSQMDSLDLNFETMATQIPLEDIYLDKELKTDWFKELDELTVPLLNAIRKLTERPRKIEKLKNRVSDLENKIGLHEKATRQLVLLIQQEKQKEGTSEKISPDLIQRLEELKEKYDPDLAQLDLDRWTAELDKELSAESESVVDSTKAFMKDFFKNRGRNLFITGAAFIGLWWLLMSLRKWISRNKNLFPLNPVLKKLFFAAYNGLVLLFCLSVAIICLYVFNDWLLLSLIIIAILVTAWTSRQWIPRFLQELRLILNLGTVCEGQRFIWKGVPWLVQEIGLWANLSNEQLEGGFIRIPVSELIGRHSRPVVQGEPWFPTNPNDWVILSDETYGKIESQTMEQVILQLKGNTLKYYSTANFLESNPQNISQGFRYTIEFGLDYGTQSRICDEILTMFDSGLRKHLQPMFEGDAPEIQYCEVMFNSAGASSLNLMITIDMHGRCADRYYPIQRTLQTTLVRICNDNKLVIPFTQLTVSLTPDLMQVANKVQT